MDVIDFPKWKPRNSTLWHIDHTDTLTRRQAIRNAASNFTKRKDVREALFRIKGDKCYICGNKATQIDHKVSAYRYYWDKSLDIRTMNSFENLFPICKSCNAGRQP